MSSRSFARSLRRSRTALRRAALPVRASQLRRCVLKGNHVMMTDLPYPVCTAIRRLSPLSPQLEHLLQ